MSQTPQPAASSEVSIPKAVLPLGLLAWAMLVYSWLLGHVQLGWQAPFVRVTLAPGGTGAIPYHSLCFFKDVTHLPCLFCGLTRSFVVIAQGHWAEAWRYHLLAWPMYLLTLFLALSALLAPAWGGRVIRWLTTRPVLAVIGSVLLLCWGWKLMQGPAYW